MKSIIPEITTLLIENKFKFREEKESLFIKLPNGFGELQIYDLSENDDIIGLVGADWHTHSECLGNPDTRAKNIIDFLSKIFSGQFLLIEEKEPGKQSRKMIEDDFKKYIKWLPQGTKYKVFNRT